MENPNPTTPGQGGRDNPRPDQGSEGDVRRDPSRTRETETEEDRKNRYPDQTPKKR